MNDLTTLQLARKIADAVFYALHPSGPGPNRSDDDAIDPPTQAVISTLHANESWFCRLADDEVGERYEPVQPRLFA